MSPPPYSGKGSERMPLLIPSPAPRGRAREGAALCFPVSAYLSSLCVSLRLYAIDRSAAAVQYRRAADEPNMQTAAHAPSPRTRPSTLKREIVAILIFKLCGLIALYFLFFDQRPDITPLRVEERVLDPAGAPQDPGRNPG